MTRTWAASAIATVMLFLAPEAVAKSPTVYTPVPGSAERAAIVKTLHAGDQSPKSRFTLRQLRVFHAGSRAIAYVQGAGPVGDFQAILQRDDKTSWREIWSESDGGSNSCAAGAQHYAWALRMIRHYPVAPDAIFPGIVARTNELQAMAKSDPEQQCVGDLGGGPN